MQVDTVFMLQQAWWIVGCPQKGAAAHAVLLSSRQQVWQYVNLLNAQQINFLLCWSVVPDGPTELPHQPCEHGSQRSQLAWS